MNEATLAISIKAKIALNLAMFALATFLTFIGIDKEALAMYALLLLVDYVTGVQKAKALKINIDSHKMKYGIVSKLYLLFIPISLSLASKATPMDISTIVSISLSLLVLSELYSIVANVYASRKGKELPEWEVLSIMARVIRDTSMGFFGDAK